VTGFRGGPGPEVFYSNAIGGTALATFTTEDNLMKGMPVCKVPDLAQWMDKLGDQTSTGKFRALIQAGAVSATTPTYTFSLRALTSTTWSAGGILLATSTACTCASGVTKGLAQVDVDFWMRTNAVPGTPTITTVWGGTVTGSAFTNACSMPPAGTDPIVTTLDMTAQYYLFLSVACSASNAANTINCQGAKLYLEN